MFFIGRSQKKSDKFTFETSGAEFKESSLEKLLVQLRCGQALYLLHKNLIGGVRKVNSELNFWQES